MVSGSCYSGLSCSHLMILELVLSLCEHLALGFYSGSCCYIFVLCVQSLVSGSWHSYLVWFLCQDSDIYRLWSLLSVLGLFVIIFLMWMSFCMRPDPLCAHGPYVCQPCQRAVPVLQSCCRLLGLFCPFQEICCFLFTLQGHTLHLSLCLYYYSFYVWDWQPYYRCDSLGVTPESIFILVL